MKKLFISQPMRGKTDEEILAVRSDAIQAAKDAVGEDVEVIESFFPERTGGGPSAVVPGEVSGAVGNGRRCLFRPRMGERERMSGRAHLCGGVRCADCHYSLRKGGYDPWVSVVRARNPVSNRTYGGADPFRR